MPRESKATAELFAYAEKFIRENLTCLGNKKTKPEVLHRIGQLKGSALTAAHAKQVAEWETWVSLPAATRRKLSKELSGKEEKAEKRLSKSQEKALLNRIAPTDIEWKRGKKRLNLQKYLLEVFDDVLLQQPGQESLILGGICAAMFSSEALSFPLYTVRSILGEINMSAIDLEETILKLLEHRCGHKVEPDHSKNCEDIFLWLLLSTVMAKAVNTHLTSC